MPADDEITTLGDIITAVLDAADAAGYDHDDALDAARTCLAQLSVTIDCALLEPDRADAARTAQATAIRTANALLLERGDGDPLAAGWLKATALFGQFVAAPANGARLVDEIEQWLADGEAS